MDCTKVRFWQYANYKVHIAGTHTSPAQCSREEDGTHDGYPKYVEQNKKDGGSFASVTPAEIRYCDDLDAWVFKHPDISVSPDGNEGHECEWLWRSADTDDYDVLSTAATAWQAWNGQVVPRATVAMTCDEGCSRDSDCNYHGTCDKDTGECACDGTHTGGACQFETPCPFLTTEKSLSFGTGAVRRGYRRVASALGPSF